MADSTTIAAAPAPVLGDGVTDRIHRAAVEALAEGEPQWLRERRLAAWDVYERTPTPTTGLEEWRYTDLSRKLHLDRLELLPWEARTFTGDSAPAGLADALRADSAASGHLVELDGTVARVDLLEEFNGALQRLRQSCELLTIESANHPSGMS